MFDSRGETVSSLFDRVFDDNYDFVSKTGVLIDSESSRDN